MKYAQRKRQWLFQWGAFIYMFVVDDGVIKRWMLTWRRVERGGARIDDRDQAWVKKINDAFVQVMRVRRATVVEQRITLW